MAAVVGSVAPYSLAWSEPMAIADMTTNDFQKNGWSAVAVQGRAGGYRAQVHTHWVPAYCFLSRVWRNCSHLGMCAREVTEQARTKGSAVHRQTAGRVTRPAAQRRPISTRAQHAGHPYASFAPSGKVWVQIWFRF